MEVWRDLLDVFAAPRQLGVHRLGLNEAALDRPLFVGSCVREDIPAEQAGPHGGCQVILAPLEPLIAAGDRESLNRHCDAPP